MNTNKHLYLLVILVGLLLVILPACQPGQAPAGTAAPAGQVATLINPALQAKLEAGEALRIMPMGGSIVEGYCDRPSQCNWPEEINTPLEGGGVEACSWSNNKANPRAVGFREFLHDKLTAEGVKVNYVGSVQEVQDLAHEGHLAFTIDDLDYCVRNASWLELTRPDVILLLTGADDAGWGETPAEILARLEKLLGHIYEKLPETTEVIIAQYPPTREELFWAWKEDSVVNLTQTLTEYNAGIPGVVEKLQADGKHVNYVNMDNVFKAADEYDESGFQPRAVAAERMAQAWLEKIMEILDKPVMVSASPTLQPPSTKSPAPPPKYYVDAPLRIMPLGDGFTEGSCDKPTNCVYPDNMTWPHDGGGVTSCKTNATLGSPGIRGYREFLRDKLAVAGVNMTYVGSVDLVEGLAHEGHYAFFITDLDYCIQNAKWLEQAQPDMILIDAGATEMFFEHPAEDTIADLRILLTSIYQKLPETTEVILAQIHPVREDLYVAWDPEKPLLNDVLAEYNAMLPAVIEEFQTEGKHVSLIDTQKVVQSQEEFDQFGAQLSPVAQERQAQVWYEKIMEKVLQPAPAATSTPETQAQAGESLLIMPLGDSITEGVCDQPDTCNVPEIKTPGTGYGLESCGFNLNVYNPAARGYREFLRDKLIEAGVDITYVGSVQVNEGLAHEGHSAFRTSDIDYCIQNADWLKQAKPDMILLHVGSADAGDGGIPANTSLVALRDILTHIYQILPETTEVILAQVIPAREDSHVNFDPSEPLVNDMLAEYNAGIPAVVEEFRAMGKHVSLVDMREAIQSADDYDEMGRHPNAIASERIAQVWFEKIMEILEQKN